MAKQTSRQMPPEDRIIDSALALAAAEGWRYVSLSDIADKAGMPLAELRRYLPAKNALMRLLTSRVDSRVLEEAQPGRDEETARDRLFDILMTRFDILSPYRAGIAAVLADCLYDPLTTARQVCTVRSSMKAMLAAAQIPTDGPFGELRTKGALLIYASVFRIWLRDNSRDLAKTMAALDKALTQADRLARRLPA